MKSTTRKWIGLLAAAVLASSLAALAGCSSPSGSASASSAAASTAAEASSGAASEAPSGAAGSSAAAEASSGEAVGMPNPWSDAATAEEAAKGAGLDAFALPEGAIADLGEPFEITYRCMDGMAEARYEFPASALTVRTAKVAADGDLDVSGDYNTYAHEWTENIGDVEVACAGNREGDSTKSYWGDASVAHSIVAEGLGGDEDFGLNAKRLTVFVEAMK